MNNLNAEYESVGKGKRKCFGCKYRDISVWCYYRWWKQESRKGYSFRMFYGKSHLLPTCRRENFDYKEQKEYKKRYIEIVGIDTRELSNNGGKRGGRKRRAYEVY